MAEQAGIAERVIEVEEAVVTLRKDGIVHVKYKSDVVIDVALQMKMLGIFNEVCGNQKRPFIFDACDRVDVTREARDNAIVMEDSSPVSATAVIASNLAYRLIAEFYMKVNKPKTPYRVFRNTEDAAKWLLSNK